MLELTQKELTYDHNESTPTVGLALGGGGAKGFAHTGVLRVLRNAGIEVHAKVGTSCGAAIGILDYFYTPDEIEKMLIDELGAPTFRRKLPGGRYLELKHMLKSGAIRKMLEKYLPANLRLEDLDPAYYVTTTDLVTGQCVVLSEGDAINAVMASMALPGFSDPVTELGDAAECPMDGGITNNLPTSVLRERNIDVVVGIDVSGLDYKGDWTPKGDKPTAVEILKRVYEIRNKELLVQQKALADVLIQPNTSEISLADLGKIGQIIEAGEEAAMKTLPKLQRMIDLAQEACMIAV